MRRTLTLTLTLALALAVARAAQGEEDPIAAVERRQEALFDKLAPAVVFISSEGRFGSGFFVDEHGLVLTNAHVVGRAAKVKVVTSDGRTLDGRVVERAADGVDLALVEVAAKSPALALAGKSPLRVGSWVAAVGHGRGGIWSFNTGMVSNLYGEGGERPVFQTQIPLNPGNSGGPVVDRTGAVVGVVTAGIEGSNAINFAIRSDVALHTLARLGASTGPRAGGDGPSVLTIDAPAGVAVFVDGKMVGKGPRVTVPAQAGAHEVFAVVDGAMRKQRVRFPEQRAVELR